MNDIKIMHKLCADYIPKNGILCQNCIYYEVCPVEYTCESFDRNIIHEFKEEKE